MALVSSLPMNNNPAVRQDRTRSWVARQKTPPVLPYTKIDPRPWQAYDRNTPGMTNRVLEDRWDEQSRIDSNLSTRSEIPNRNDDTVLPEALRRQFYLQYALIFGAAMVLYVNYIT
jgi:hypothetical protein